VLTFYTLAFAITWGGLLAIGGLGGISGTRWQSDPRPPLLVAVMLAGPGVAGLLLTGLVDGRAGRRQSLARSMKWRVAPAGTRSRS
jgi:hypothetical protein